MKTVKLLCYQAYWNLDSLQTHKTEAWRRLCFDILRRGFGNSNVTKESGRRNWKPGGIRAGRAEQDGGWSLRQHFVIVMFGLCQGGDFNAADRALDIQVVPADMTDA